MTRNCRPKVHSLPDQSLAAVPYECKCLAKTLNLLGDRWSLQIIGRLLFMGPHRYTDLLHGLPGIASNLLADRLRKLEESGVIERRRLSPPIASTLLQLTDRGRDLRAAVQELGRWGDPLMQMGDAVKARSGDTSK